MIQRLMKLQKQPTESCCVATAYAMALGMDVGELLKQLPNAEELFWPELEQHNKRGHHPQELIDIAYSKDIAIIEIQVNPHIEHYNPAVKGITKPIYDVDKATTRLGDYLYTNYGVIFGTMGFNVGHAVAWDGEKAYDPRGEILTELTMSVSFLHIFKPIGKIDLPPLK